MIHPNYARSWHSFPCWIHHLTIMNMPWYSLEGLMLKVKLQYFGHLLQRVDSLEKTDAGRDWRQEEKGTTEDEMTGWHHRLDRHEFGWTPGVGDRQGSLECCDSWGRKESNTTEWLNWLAVSIAKCSLWESKFCFNSSENQVTISWFIAEWLVLLNFAKGVIKSTPYFTNLRGE